MEKKIIEINGVKLEVDLREAKTIDTLKVGDRVKLLRKRYSDEYSSEKGVVIGFDQFQNLPTIIVMFFDDYGDIEYAYINSQSGDKYEIVKSNEWDIDYSKSEILEKLNKQIEEKEQSLKKQKDKKQMFLKLYGKFIEE